MIENRLLDVHEQSVEILNRSANSYHVVTSSRIFGLLEIEIIRQALNLLQKRHPRLNSKIVGNLNSLRFEAGAKPIPLKVVNKFHSEEWQEVALEELNQKINSDEVLMRVVLVRVDSEININYLITTLHHAIIDGLSSVKLHSEILTYCQKIADGELISDVVSLQPLPIIQEMLPNSMRGFAVVIKSTLFILKTLLQLLWYRPVYLGFEKYVPVALRRSSIIHKQLDAKTTQEIVLACKREKTTVQSALCAALMLATAKRISQHQEKIRLSCLSYVNLRNRLKFEVGAENLGMLVASINLFHTLDKNTLLWYLAQDVKQKLEVNLKTDEIFSNLLVSKILSTFFLKNPKQIPSSIAVSNVGRVNIPEIYGQLKLEEISFMTAVALFGGVVVVGACTFSDKMFLNFMFSEPSISRETIEEIAFDTINLLKQSS